MSNILNILISFKDFIVGFAQLMKVPQLVDSNLGVWTVYVHLIMKHWIGLRVCMTRKIQKIRQKKMYE